MPDTSLKQSQRIAKLLKDYQIPEQDAKYLWRLLRPTPRKRKAKR